MDGIRAYQDVGTAVGCLEPIGEGKSGIVTGDIQRMKGEELVVWGTQFLLQRFHCL